MHLRRLDRCEIGKSSSKTHSAITDDYTCVIQLAVEKLTCEGVHTYIAMQGKDQVNW